MSKYALTTRTNYREPNCRLGSSFGHREQAWEKRERELPPNLVERADGFRDKYKNFRERHPQLAEALRHSPGLCRLGLGRFTGRAALALALAFPRLAPAAGVVAEAADLAVTARQNTRLWTHYRNLQEKHADKQRAFSTVAVILAHDPFRICLEKQITNKWLETLGPQENKLQARAKIKALLAQPVEASGLRLSLLNWIVLGSLCEIPGNADLAHLVLLTPPANSSEFSPEQRSLANTVDYFGEGALMTAIRGLPAGAKSLDTIAGAFAAELIKRAQVGILRIAREYQDAGMALPGLGSIAR
jgi:hypothetical protein